MVTRREFLKTAAAGAGSVLLDHRTALGRRRAALYYGLHEFVESHPQAVFVFRTSVNDKTDAAAITTAGHALGNTLFVARTGPENAYAAGAPVALKPNLTAWAWDIPTPPPPFLKNMGIQTDASFVEGIIASLVDLAVPPADIHVLDANYSGTASDGAWYRDLAARTGITLKELPVLSSLGPGDVVWTSVPGGVWYSKIPHLWPVNAPGSPLINIAKLKSHSMGMTLCSKNLQGTNARPYVRHCTAWNSPISGVNPGDIMPDAFATIKQNYDAHRAAIPRWNTLNGDPASGSAGGLWMETHTARCLDNNAALTPLVNIIEGVYGREGPFVTGPGPDGLGVDVMANCIIFGKNARHVDIIGAYIAGHEPGNFGLFHIARERGLSGFLNPHEIPLYEWSSGGTAALTTLAAFTRVPIRTLYLPQAGEAQYHMVDQPYDYGTTSAGRRTERYAAPDALVVEQNYPNPFNPSTSIQYYIPAAGHVRVEVFDVRGDLTDVLVDGVMQAGEHLVTWRSGSRASGTYYYRIRFGGTSRTKSMILLR